MIYYSVDGFHLEKSGGAPQPTAEEFAAADVLFAVQLPANLTSIDQTPRLRLFQALSSGTGHSESSLAGVALVRRPADPPALSHLDSFLEVDSPSPPPRILQRHWPSSQPDRRARRDEHNDVVVRSSALGARC